MDKSIKISAIGVLLGYCLPLLLSLSNVTEFVTHFDYYSQEVCINKDLPELKCNGTCALAKMMLETTNDSNRNEPTTFEETTFLIGFLYSQESKAKVFKKEYLNSTYTKFLKSQYSLAKVLRPPIV
jgi:hypothetical protein